MGSVPPSRMAVLVRLSVDEVLGVVVHHAILIAEIVQSLELPD